MQLTFESELWYWRGPSPFHFLPIPAAESAEIRTIAPMVSYGWGCIPVSVRIGEHAFSTALIPKDGRYLVPVRDRVRAAAAITVGDAVEVEVAVELRR